MSSISSLYGSNNYSVSRTEETFTKARGNAVVAKKSTSKVGSDSSGFSEEATLRFNYAIQMRQYMKACNIEAGRTNDTYYCNANYMEDNARAYAHILSGIKETYADDLETQAQHIAALLAAFNNNMDVDAKQLSSRVDLDGLIQIDINNPQRGSDVLHNKLKLINDQFIDLFTGYLNNNGADTALSLVKSDLGKSNDTITSWLLNLTQSKIY